MKALGIVIGFCLPGLAVAAEGKIVPIEITVTDVAGKSLPCRIHLSDADGKPHQPPGLPFWRDHFVCGGRVKVQLQPGEYTWVVERGPEYAQQRGQLKVGTDAPRLNVTLKRIAELRDSGWYSGDLHVHRRVEETEALMAAEDLDFAPVITWWNQRGGDVPIPRDAIRRFDEHRLYEIGAGEDEREGGALLYFGLREPLDIRTNSREFPSPMKFVQAAHQRNKDVWIDIEKPFWWDVPTWLASGEMNSIGIANNHMCRSQMYENEAWGKPRDEQRLAPPRGNGYWTQEIYYHILNSGLRLPPSAGSASGVLPNPVGYNRVYVHLDEPFTRDTWFDGLSKGRCFVTNGPLLLVTADEKRPGATLTLDQKPQPIKLQIQLISKDPVGQIEIVQNGRVVHLVDTSDEQKQSWTVTLDPEGPGWFLVRAITDVEHTFRFASTGPWYVETESVKHHIQKDSAQFFLDWVDERMARIRKNVKNPQQLESVLAPHVQAKKFWTSRVQMANDDVTRRVDPGLRRFAFSKEQTPDGCVQVFHKLTNNRLFIKQLASDFFDRKVDPQVITAILYSVFEEDGKLGIFGLAFQNAESATTWHDRLQRAYANEDHRFDFSRRENVVVCLWRDEASDACFNSFRNQIQQRVGDKRR